MKSPFLVVSAFLILISFLPLELSAQCISVAPNSVAIGGILNKVYDADRDRPFNDVFKLNRGFASDPLNPLASPPASIDTLGWPTQDFSVVVMTDMTPDMGGTYHIQFNGSATISPFSSAFVVQNQAYDSTANLTTASLVYPDTITIQANLILSFQNTQYDPKTKGVKNISIMKPGTTFGGSTFSRPFTVNINRFNVLNFSQWRSIYTSTDSLWANRASTIGSQVGNQGVAWDYCIELANDLNKDIWINIPHRADDDYVLNLAQSLKGNLNKNLNIYVEYSSDIWDFTYLPAQWNNYQASIEGVLPNCPYNPDHVTDPFTLNIRRYAYKTKRIADIFRGVFGNLAINHQIRVVYSGQLNWLDYAQRGLDFMEQNWGKPDSFIYALAVSPYVGVNQLDVQKPNTASTADVLNTLQINLTNAFNPDSTYIDQWAARAAWYGVKFYAYAGGINTAGDYNVTPKMNAARAPQMKTICANYLTKWYGYGAAGLVNWNAAGAGAWNTNAGTFPLTENFEASYKLQGVDSVLAAPIPALSAGQSVATPLDAREIASVNRNGTTGTDYYLPGTEPFVDYLFRVPSGSSGDYKITFQARSATGSQFMNVYIDNQLVSKMIVPYTGSLTGAYKSSDSLLYKGLSEGLHSLRLQWLSLEFDLHSITFTRVKSCTVTATENLVQAGFKVFPNPASNELTIEWSDLTTAHSIFKLTDLAGRTVLEKQITFPAQLNVTNLAGGMYFYSFWDGNNTRIGQGKVLVVK